mgnify:CR=1 FL=1
MKDTNNSNHYIFQKVATLCGLRISLYITIALLILSFLVLNFSGYRTASPFYITVFAAILPEWIQMVVFPENNNKKECVKIVINCVDKKEKEKMIEIVKHSNIHIYASRFHVNIINRKVNKEMALRELFKIEKLDYGLLNVIGDNDNDYKMLKAFNGGVIKKHNEVLDELNKEEYETLAEFIDKVIEKDGKKNGD